MAALMSSGLCKWLLVGGSLDYGVYDWQVLVYGCDIADVPASADDGLDPAKHKLLLRLSVSDVPNRGGQLGVAANGAIEKPPADRWYGVALDSGEATFFRFVSAYDNNGYSDNAGWAQYGYRRLQGMVGAGGADLNMDSTNIAAGVEYVVRSFKIDFAG